MMMNNDDKTINDDDDGGDDNEVEEYEDEDDYVDVSFAQDGGVMKKILRMGVGGDRAPTTTPTATRAPASSSASPPPPSSSSSHREEQEETSSLSSPQYGSIVEMHYVGTILDKAGRIHKFDTSYRNNNNDSTNSNGNTFQFQMGDGNVIRGWEEGIASMTIGEKSIFKVRYDYGYGQRGQTKYNIPSNTNLLYVIELLNFTSSSTSKTAQPQNDADDIQLLTPRERITIATTLKEFGTELFQAKKYDESATKYEESASYCTAVGDGNEEELMESRLIYVMCWNNVAMCCIKLQKWKKTINACNHVLDIQTISHYPKSAIKVKGLYRRGIAYYYLGLYRDAKMDLMKAFKIDSTNKDVRKALQQLKQTLSEQKSKEKLKEKDTYCGIFGSTTTSDSTTTNDAGNKKRIILELYNDKKNTIKTEKERKADRIKQLLLEDTGGAGVCTIPAS